MPSRSARPPRPRSAPDAPPFLSPTAPQAPPALPRPPRNLELPRPPAPTRALELPRRPFEPARTETERTEPGSWREIIARFEHELGDVVDTGDADAAASEHEPPSAPRDAPPAGGTEAAHAPRGAGPQPEEGEEDALPWEFEAMTTPDYVPHRPIHDPGGREWPVDAEDGAAIEPWPGPDEPAPDDADAVDELLLDDAVPVDPWDVEAEPDDGEPASEFPLDAFIVPDNVRSVPTGYDEGDVAHRVALRLDELAEELRSGGLNALGATQSTDELSRVLAAIVTGYVAREG